MFKLDVTEDGGIVLKEVYSGVSLKSDDGELFTICMRDSGFEFNYGGNWYEAKDGIISFRGENVIKDKAN